MLDLTKDTITFTTDVFADATTPHEIYNLDKLDNDTKIQYYEELFAFSLIQRAHKRNPRVSGVHQEKIFPYIKVCLDWLRSTDFYTSPASTKYHDSRYGGLLDHTLQVYNQLVGLRQVPKFHTVVDDQWYSAVFVALVHDWCKIGRYEQYYKKVYNDGIGEWETTPAFKYREDDTVRFGHGTQSLVIAMRLCNSLLTSLTFEEMAAIRWHMDAWDIGHYDNVDLGQCNEKIPMVRMIQFADQLAITSY